MGYQSSRGPVTWQVWTKWSLLLGGCAAIALVGYQLFWRYHAKRYQVVREGFLYRVAQPTELSLRYLIKDRGVRTVITLQLYRPTLKRGMYDPGRPNGRQEGQFVRQLGARYLEWPQGQEACWPWPTPWMFEEFFRVLDDPANRPVVVHCMGGRHRTGTLAALFRLEYDRWPVEKALDEMYGFQFGEPISLHEHNLRTYLPRPHPSPEVWRRLLAYWQPLLTDGQTVSDYEQLVWRLREAKTDPRIEQAITKYLSDESPFAICLAQRLIETPSESLAELAAERASQCLERDQQPRADWASAAALVADFGTSGQQQRLLAILENEPLDSPPSPRYQAVVAGITNRYTANRIAYLKPLLRDTRRRPEPAASRYRYCDTAMARLSVMIDLNLMEHGEAPPGMTHWDYACQLARKWIEDHATTVQLSQLVPPSGNNSLLAGELPSQEDLSRMRK